MKLACGTSFMASGCVAAADEETSSRGVEEEIQGREIGLSGGVDKVLSESIFPLANIRKD